MMVFLKEFVQKVDFDKLQQTTKSKQNYPEGKKLSIISSVAWGTSLTFTAVIQAISNDTDGWFFVKL